MSNEENKAINENSDHIELKAFKEDLLNLIHVASDVSGDFSESKFFDDITELLCEAGVYDDIQKDTYINSRKGIRIDGMELEQNGKNFICCYNKILQ